jgi:hypothetical protein
MRTENNATATADEYPTTGISWKDLYGGDSSHTNTHAQGNNENSVESGQLSPR